MSDIVSQIYEASQITTINTHPSPSHASTSSTTASQRQPLHVLERIPSEAGSISTGIVDSSRIVKPPSRRRPLPPLPDLRFQQSYLASLKGADSWGRIAWITVRDQILLPLIQGTLWTLALCGWRYWNRGAQFRGRSIGMKIRRWWWKVNNWKIPE